MAIVSVTVGGVTYNIAQAPAIKQKRLMLLLGGKITLNASISGIEKIDTVFLKGSLITLPEEVFDEVTNIVLSRCMISGRDTPITVEDFGGSMNDFFTLVAEAVAANLNDFFTWLDSANAERRAPVNKNDPV